MRGRRGRNWRTRQLLRAFVPVTVLASAWAAAQAPTGDDLRWREKVGWNEEVHGPNLPRDLAKVVARVPYAYYPYDNALEVLFDFDAAVKLLPGGTRAPAVPPRELTVRVLPERGAQVLASGRMALDAKGRGRGTFRLPELPKGVFRVEYLFGGVTLKAPRTFMRSHFEFEHNEIGEQHEVYAPFTPVEVAGRTVSVVDRTYTVNGLGLFDSVVSKGRELLAGPIRLVVETADGTEVVWGEERVEGRVLHPDLAEFRTGAQGAGLRVESTVKVEEDGCAKVDMTLEANSARAAPTIRRAWLEIALKESEAPLCHLVGMDSMRHNYAGYVPRGGEITWIMQPWRPARFERKPFAGDAPSSYEVWNATQLRHWDKQRWNFAPYIWLGAERRGLAWFGDHIRGYETDGRRGIQRLRIEPGRVVLRVELIQQPVRLDAPRRYEFGLQASPTKPMPEGWRGYDVPGGGGMQVNVWGGYFCSWHYPDPKDWSLVEKIVEGRRGRLDRSYQIDRAFFEELNRRRAFPTLKIQDRRPWLDDVLGFAQRNSAVAHPHGVTVYYEEFYTAGNHPESDEYQDEWDMAGWYRGLHPAYRYTKPGPHIGPVIRTAGAQSFRDFAVYYADQWMRRGVGVYYDNTYPKVERNPYVLRDTQVPWSSTIWVYRDYMRRVWKRSRELMAQESLPLDTYYSMSDSDRRMRLHIVGHVTNCQVLPYTTWWDASLGIEAPGHWLPDDTPSAEEMARQVQERGFVVLPTPKRNTPGTPLPYPPDYLRAMTMGRMGGIIPHYRHKLRSEDAFGGLGISYGSTKRPPRDLLARRQLSDKAMGLVHEIRGAKGGTNWVRPEDYEALVQAFIRFGYCNPRPEDPDSVKSTISWDFVKKIGGGGPVVKVHNYWAERPFVAVSDPEVKWIALERDRRLSPYFGLLLLQSYRADACEVKVDFPGAGALFDILSGTILPADRPLVMAADYGTRLLVTARDAAALEALAAAPDPVARLGAAGPGH